MQRQVPIQDIPRTPERSVGPNNEVGKDDVSGVTESPALVNKIKIYRAPDRPPYLMEAKGYSQRWAWAWNWCMLIMPNAGVSASNHCTGAFCLRCESMGRPAQQCTINYHPRNNSKSVTRHFMKYHAQLETEYATGNEEEDANEGKGNIKRPADDHASPEMLAAQAAGSKRARQQLPETRLPDVPADMVVEIPFPSSSTSKYKLSPRNTAIPSNTTGAVDGTVTSVANQSVFEILLGKWIAQYMIPLDALNNDAFRSVLKCVNTTKKELELPVEFRLRLTAEMLASKVKDKLKKVLNDECIWASLTHDVWMESTLRRQMESWTIHFVADNFKLQSFTVEVKPADTSTQRVHAKLNEILATWDIYESGVFATSTAYNGPTVIDMESTLSPCISSELSAVLEDMMFRDDCTNAGTGLQACNETTQYSKEESISLDWLRETQGSIAAALRRASFLTKYHGLDTTLVMVKTKYESLVYRDCEEDRVLRKNASRRKNGVMLATDAKWYKALLTLKRMLDLRNHFQGLDCFPEILTESWALITGVVSILSAVQLVFDRFNQELYPSLPLVLPANRLLCWYLGSKVGMNSAGANDTLKAFHGESFFPQIVSSVEKFRLLLLESLKSTYYFGLEHKLMWTTILDPRNFKRTANYWEEGELEQAKIKLITEAVGIKSELDLILSRHRGGRKVTRGVEALDALLSFRDNKEMNITTTCDVVSDGEDPERKQCETEVASFFNDELDRLPTSSEHLQSLQDVGVWWRERSHKYPRLALLARKCLSIPVAAVRCCRDISRALDIGDHVGSDSYSDNVVFSWHNFELVGDTEEEWRGYDADGRDRASATSTVA